MGKKMKKKARLWLMRMMLRVEMNSLRGAYRQGLPIPDQSHSDNNGFADLIVEISRGIGKARKNHHMICPLVVKAFADKHGRGDTYYKFLRYMNP